MEWVMGRYFTPDTVLKEGDKSRPRSRNKDDWQQVRKLVCVLQSSIVPFIYYFMRYCTAL